MIVGDYDLMTKEQALKSAADWFDGGGVLVKAENIIRKKSTTTNANLPVIEV
jgi:hypothetical protein